MLKASLIVDAFDETDLPAIVEHARRTGALLLPTPSTQQFYKKRLSANFIQRLVDALAASNLLEKITTVRISRLSCDPEINDFAFLKAFPMITDLYLDPIAEVQNLGVIGSLTTLKHLTLKSLDARQIDFRTLIHLESLRLIRVKTTATLSLSNPALKLLKIHALLPEYLDVQQLKTLEQLEVKAPHSKLLYPLDLSGLPCLNRLTLDCQLIFSPIFDGEKFTYEIYDAELAMFTEATNFYIRTQHLDPYQKEYTEYAANILSPVIDKRLYALRAERLAEARYARTALEGPATESKILESILNALYNSPNKKSWFEQAHLYADELKHAFSSFFAQRDISAWLDKIIDHAEDNVIKRITEAARHDTETLIAWADSNTDKLDAAPLPRGLMLFSKLLQSPTPSDKQTQTSSARSKIPEDNGTGVSSPEFITIEEIDAILEHMNETEIAEKSQKEEHKSCRHTI